MESQEVQLSIVVPIYNVEAYLADCLDSILTQKGLSSIEVILVDDGSRDGSTSIAKSYAEQNADCFHYFLQSNQGLSVARNSGLEKAVGKYVLFFDSDDVLFDNGLSRLLEIAVANQLDVVQGNFSHLHDKGIEELNKSICELECVTGEEWLHKALKRRKYLPAAWLKLYKREFLISNNLKFKPGLINEDQLFAIQVFKSAHKVSSYNIPFYKYRHRNNSISSHIGYESALARVQSDLFTCGQLASLSRTFSDPRLERLVMERCIKLLGTSVGTLISAAPDNDEEVSDICRRVDDLKLQQYVRFSRASHYFDWFCLKKGFRSYVVRRRLG